MPILNYKALDARGHETRGVIECRDEDEARERLDSMGFRLAYFFPDDSTVATGVGARPSGTRFFGLIVCLFAIAFALTTVGLPLWQIREARDWVPTPCEVLSSQMRSGTETMRAIIQFRYQFQGQTYESQHFQFGDMSSGSFGQHQAVVAGYPAGLKTNCFVNPLDPTEAVILRSNAHAFTTWIFFSALFLVLGISLLFVRG